MDSAQLSEPQSPRPAFQRYWFDIPLWRILPALVLGVAVGLICGEGAVQVRWLGDIFVRLPAC